MLDDPRGKQAGGLRYGPAFRAPAEARLQLIQRIQRGVVSLPASDGE